jgi:peptidoglycan/LPS O-acetylase OafA/YrhL
LDARHHIDELQSLRGAAALVVVFSHLSSIYPFSRSAHIAFDAVFNPHASIIVFFVLSGYVLTGSLLRRGLSWAHAIGFYLNRLFRLFPGLWAASAISAFFLAVFPQQVIHPAANAWFSYYLTPFPNATGLILAALAIDRSLIMPVWTIFIELMGSALMPFFVTIAITKQRLFVWMLLGVGIASYMLAYAPHRLNSLAYMFDFALGVWLASRDWKLFAGTNLPRLFAAAATLVFFRFAWFSIRAGHLMPLYGYDDPLPMLVEGIAAFFLIGALASERGRVRFLRSPWAVWLGDISFGLYLIHFPVAIVVAKIVSRAFSDATSPVTAIAVVIPLVLVISCILAYLLHRFVEIPSIAFGKRVSKRFFLSSTPGTPVRV